jgi:arylsulfatase A-like enzyme
MRWSVWLLLAMVGFRSQLSAADKPRLNVLFLMSDDLRPDLGCYGNSRVQSPNIDALAAAGVRFERAYVQFPLCNPSRTSLLTGRYPTTTGVLDNQGWFGGVHPDWVSLPRFFKDQGYAALRTGKIFHGGIDDADAWTAGGETRKFEGAIAPRPANRANRAQNSDRIISLEGDGESHGDHRTADQAIEYLRAHRDQPFFLACGFTKPHSPPTAPAKYLEQYAAVDVPLPPDFAARPAALPGFPKSSITSNGDLFINRDATPEAAQEMIRAYWSSVTWMDWNLGRVMHELDQLGLREKTVIVFWGDHGYHLGEKGKWSKHGSLYEIGDRVPLIIAAPGRAGNGSPCPRIVETVDLYPTLAQLCGLTPPQGLQGDSLVPLLDAPAAAWDKPAFTVAANNGELSGIAVRTERYRYAVYPGEDGAEMLIDETADPHELKNLATDPALAEVRRELSGRVLQFRAETLK